ncbi:TPA: branched-chain amino acid ABC transporter substrate-binding protein, partial [Escherichia coli]|nr:branched-chain amino acid ABC transporter substrate-binding protein [Escherichia coli]
MKVKGFQLWRSLATISLGAVLMAGCGSGGGTSSTPAAGNSDSQPAAS